MNAPSLRPRPPSRRGKKAWSRALKLVRRVHLYSGLALLPFVAIYGISAYLFNHPERGTEHPLPTGTLDRAAIAFPDADEVAAGLTTALVARGARTPEHAPPAEWRGSLLLLADTDDTRFVATIDPSTAEGTWRRSERSAPRPAPAFLEGFEPQRPAGLDFDAGKDALAEFLGWENAPEVSVRRSPTVRFQLEEDGALWNVRYDPARNRISAEPADTDPEAWDGFFKRLHKAHTYPNEFGARFLWALLVDAMAVSMVAWAVSGLLMWWQMKNLRRPGLFIVMGCGGATWWLMAAMARELAG